MNFNALRSVYLVLLSIKLLLSFIYRNKSLIKYKLFIYRFLIKGLERSSELSKLSKKKRSLIEFIINYISKFKIF